MRVAYRIQEVLESQGDLELELLLLEWVQELREGVTIRGRAARPV